MSSAILYLAIIAIWACVLIPRWLKRDSARGAAVPAATEPTTELPDAADTVPSDGPDDAPLVRQGHSRPAATPISREEARQRVLKARRQLLWTLLGLAAAAAVLAGTGLAAWWVIAPPTVMLAGYLLMLREASRADAEASQREHEALEARRAARARRARALARQARAGATTVAPAVPVTYAAAPVPADYDDEGPGRDFTLGRRYAPSASTSALASAAAVDDDDDADDQYTENRLRAVGD
ncbi:MAG TPA: hypothetical protein VHZ03_53720 [Trebonia sp.]|jgi:hypothetical protein|nr:hypothetical protein [Trebonia sp.]